MNPPPTLNMNNGNQPRDHFTNDLIITLEIWNSKYEDLPLNFQSEYERLRTASPRDIQAEGAFIDKVVKYFEDKDTKEKAEKEKKEKLERVLNAKIENFEFANHDQWYQYTIDLTEILDDYVKSLQGKNKLALIHLVKLIKQELVSQNQIYNYATATIVNETGKKDLEFRSNLRFKNFLKLISLAKLLLDPANASDTNFDQAASVEPFNESIYEENLRKYIKDVVEVLVDNPMPPELIAEYQDALRFDDSDTDMMHLQLDKFIFKLKVYLGLENPIELSARMEEVLAKYNYNNCPRKFITRYQQLGENTQNDANYATQVETFLQDLEDYLKTVTTKNMPQTPEQIKESLAQANLAMFDLIIDELSVFKPLESALTDGGTEIQSEQGETFMEIVDRNPNLVDEYTELQEEYLSLKQQANEYVSEDESNDYYTDKYTVLLEAFAKKTQEFSDKLKTAEAIQEVVVLNDNQRANNAMYTYLDTQIKKLNGFDEATQPMLFQQYKDLQAGIMDKTKVEFIQDLSTFIKDLRSVYPGAITFK